MPSLREIIELRCSGTALTTVLVALMIAVGLMACEAGATRPASDREATSAETARTQEAANESVGPETEQPRDPAEVPADTPAPTEIDDPTPVPQVTPSPTPAATPESSPTSAPVPTAAPTPAASPTQVPTATPTQVPPATPTQVSAATPTQVPTPTLILIPVATVGIPEGPTATAAAPASAHRTLRGVELPWGRRYPNHWQMLNEVASQTPEVADVLLNLPWVGQEFTDHLHPHTLQFLMEYALDNPDAGQSLALTYAGVQWLRDGISQAEYDFLLSAYSNQRQGAYLQRWLGYLSNSDPESLQATSTPPPASTRPPRPSLGPQLALSDLPWATGSMTSTQQEALATLERIERAHGDLLGIVLRFHWVADDITADERTALSHLAQVAGKFSGSGGAALAEALGRTEWLIDSITPNENQFLERLTQVWEPSTIIAALAANSYVWSLDDWTP